MAERTAFPSAPLPSRQFFPFVSWLRSRLLARWYDRHLQRLDLAEIDDHQLRDLGLTRRECAKSFWQP
ncbi:MULTISPECIES: DUF1127 domain-containing protein [unclassified Mesorhizobium]|uniref:DUF1127 domain-containing protein n=1 Tax=unclassified Mesorhizobium TaxID=325217 RepID=UPI000FDCD391|nr:MULTISPECIES: DUF1127 domain-containing protein [unclassified Mesorhizobium]AZV18840.1 DUF1127 domain-containing protein [Mesorhizobium sp. M7A.F.Ce.TU.012.03.2.1]RWP11410.1 MAG: DUF1127 domain-containing protein [Mesorhizobium sp.]